MRHSLDKPPYTTAQDVTQLAWEDIIATRSPRSSRRRRSPWWPVWRPVGVSMASVLAIGLLAVSAPATSAGIVLHDMSGNVVVADPGSIPSDDEVLQMELVDDIGMRLRIPEVGLDVPLGEMNEVAGMVRPPGFTSAFMVRNRGVLLDDAADGTVYVAMHSVRDGRAPGNYLIDIPAGQPTVKVGDTVHVANLVYRVDSVDLIAKTDLPSVAELWESEPGRIVIITCLQRMEGRSLQNLVVQATLAS